MKAVKNQLQSNLVAILKDRGLTQMALSKLTNGVVSQGTISHICRGRATANDVIEAIAEALEIPVWRLLVAPDSHVAQLVDTYEEDLGLKQLTELYLLIPPSERDFIQQFVKRELALRKGR